MCPILSIGAKKERERPPRRRPAALRDDRKLFVKILCVFVSLFSVEKECEESEK